MAKIVGKNTAFTATGHLTVRTEGNRELNLEVVYAMLDGKLRCEVDASKAKDFLTSPGALAESKRLRMDRAVAISLPDRDAGYALYPRLKAYCEIPRLTAGMYTNTAERKSITIEKTKGGKEIIDGHVCAKYHVIVTLENGVGVEGTNWEATDLNGFPIMIVVPLGDDTVTMVFKKVKLHRPPASLFEPPRDYKRFASSDDLIRWAQQLTQTSQH